MLKNTKLLSSDALRQKVSSAKSRFIKHENNASITIGFYHKGNLFVVSDKPEVPLLRYNIGSVTKTVTAHLILDLKENGLINLDAKISDYLPLPKGDYPTVYELLTHTAGYKHATPIGLTVPGFLHSGFGKRNIYSECSRDDVLKALCKRKKTSKYRGKYGYSDFSYASLALVAEAILNKPFSDILESFVYNSLHLCDTSITTDESPLIIKSKNISHKSSVWKWKRDNPYIAGGGLNSTISDMLNYLAMQIENNEPFITGAHSICASTLSDNRRSACCIGWHTYKNSNVFWHIGAVGSFRSSLIFNKKRKLGVAVLGNSKGTRSANVNYIAKMLYGEIKANKIDFSRIVL